MTDVTLIEHPLSPYAQKVKIALIEKGISYASSTPFGGDDESLSAFQVANPRGEVPILVVGAANLYDSSIILEYLEESWPQPALLPQMPLDRARVRTVEEVMDTHFEANTWGLSEITIFRRASGSQAEQMVAFGRSQIERWYLWLDQQLDNRPFFNGEAFGWGDLAVIPLVNGAARFDILPTRGTALHSWYERVNERPSVATAQTEALAAELDPDTMSAALAAGFKRQYRDHRLEWMVRAGGLDIVQAGLLADNIRFTEPFAGA